MIMSVYRPSRLKEGKRVRSRFYYGQYRFAPDAKLVRVPLYTPDRRMAEDLLRKIVSDEQQAALGLIPVQAIREAAQRKLAEHRDDYIADLRKCGVAEMHAYIVERRLSRLMKECKWECVRDVTADAFVTWRTRQSKSPTTLNQYRDGMIGFLKWMQRQGRLAANPLAVVGKVETRGREVRRRRALSDAELQRLLDAVPPERRAVYVAATFTGLRRGELAQLTWDDVNLDHANPFVRVRASITKNHEEALLPLHGDVVSALESIRPAEADPHTRVFGRIPSIRRYRQDLTKAEISYLDGGGRQADFHSLRHTFGTNLGRAGVQPRVAMELMRHADMRLTTRIYTDASKLPTSAAIASLPGVTLVPPEICAQPDAQKDAQSAVLSGVAKSRQVADADPISAAESVSVEAVTHA